MPGQPAGIAAGGEQGILAGLQGLQRVLGLDRGFAFFQGVGNRRQDAPWPVSRFK